MPRLLPAIATREDYYRVRHQPTEEWLPALRALGERHGLPGEAVQRSARRAEAGFTFAAARTQPPGSAPPATGLFPSEA